MQYGTKARRRFERRTYIDTRGMDHRQARRFMKRVDGGRVHFFFDEFNPLNDPALARLYSIFTERVYYDSPISNPPKTMQEDRMTQAAAPMTEDEFYTKHEPRESPEGSDIWERRDVLALLDAGDITDKHVWSFVDDGDGGVGGIAGWHMVNLLGYQVTKVPWEDETASWEENEEDKAERDEQQEDE